MRIACPSCNAVYQVPDEQLEEGRIVRCVRCGTDWSPVLDIPVGGETQDTAPDAVTPHERAPEGSAPEEPGREGAGSEEADAASSRRMVRDEDLPATVRPVIVPSAAAAGAAPAAVRRGGPWLAIAWAVSVAVVIGAGVALVLGRETVMQVWPPSIRAYVALGLAARP